MDLRWYQSEACDAVWNCFRNNQGNPLIELPTGAGKSLCIAELCRAAVQDHAGQVIVLAHRKELLEQNYSKIVSLLPPSVKAGLFSAGLRRYSQEEPIIVAGIQSCYEKASWFGRRHLVIVDEAHLVPSDGNGMYQTFLTDLQRYNDRLRIVGLTATPFRTGEGALWGDDCLFTHVCYSAGLRRLIDEGFLCPITSKPTRHEYDTSGLKVKRGEFVERDLVSLFGDQSKVLSSTQEIVEKTAGRRSILVFTTGVAHAELVQQSIEELTGERVGIVTGDTMALERATLLRQFASQELRWLVNIDVLTTGFDAPCIDALAILRATASPGLFAQICGRGLRKHHGKADCIAEGQRVLTDHGLVEIQNVTKEMKVWDGVDFVDHCGIILRGELPVISYAGLTATGDHNVYTEKGWMPFRDAKQQKIGICITGDDETAIRKSENLFRSDYSKRKRQGLCLGSVFGMRREKRKRLRFYSSIKSRMQKMRKETKQIEAVFRSPQVVANALHFSQAKMHQSSRWSLGELRRARDRVRVRVAKSYGCVLNERVRNNKRLRDRSNRQRQRILSRELASGSAKSKCEQSTGSRWSSTDAQIQDALSRRNVCGQHIVTPSQNNVVQGSCREVPEEIGQTKRRVWDILNCGPRHRFTCEGLLVSNCLVLDFGENIKRHGPLDDLNFGKQKKRGASEFEGETPMKECPNCKSAVPVSRKECECGWMFPGRELNHEELADTESKILSEPESFEVVQVAWGRHSKREGTDSLRVDYQCKRDDGNIEERISEWICIEHEGFARRKAEQWWKAHCLAPCPETIDEAIEYFDRSAVALPSAIVARKEGKFWRVTHQTLGTLPPEQDWIELEAMKELEEEEMPF